jgi:hypothetical protein
MRKPGYTVWSSVTKLKLDPYLSTEDKTINQIPVEYPQPMWRIVHEN